MTSSKTQINFYHLWIIRINTYKYKLPCLQGYVGTKHFIENGCKSTSTFGKEAYSFLKFTFSTIQTTSNTWVRMPQKLRHEEEIGRHMNCKGKIGHTIILIWGGTLKSFCLYYICDRNLERSLF
jgi:hypothetical protein